MLLISILSQRFSTAALLLMLVLLASPLADAKTGSIKRASDLSKKDFQEFLETCPNKLPKFWATLESIRDQGVHIKISADRKMGPGKAAGKDRMVISSYFVMNDLPRFPEDRLIIVLYHEFGHNVFNRKTNQSERNPVKHEYAAFAYSLKMAVKLAEAGDPGPLKQGLHYMELRSKRGKPRDPHTIALKQLVESELWEEAEEVLENASHE